MKLFVASSIIALMSASCLSPTLVTPATSGTRLSELKVKFVGLERFTAEQRKLLDGYQIIVTPTGESAKVDSCKVKDDVTTAQELTKLTLSTTIIRNCKYLVVLNVGKLDEKKEQLTTVYFSNTTAESAGTIVVADKAIVGAKFEILPRPAAIKAGLAKEGDKLSVEPNNTDSKLEIDASFGGSSGQSGSVVAIPVKINLKGEEGADAFQVKKGALIELAITQANIVKEGDCGSIVKIHPDVYSDMVKDAAGKDVKKVLEQKFAPRSDAAGMSGLVFRFTPVKDGELTWMCGGSSEKGKIILNYSE